MTRAALTLAVLLAAAPAHAEDPIKAGRDLIAEIRESVENGARFPEQRVRNGFRQIEDQFGAIEDGFRAVGQGFARVKDELRRGVQRDASIAAIAAIPDQGPGWSAGVGLSIDGHHGAPGAALSLGYANERHAWRVTVAGPEFVATLGFSARW